jgi:hypothetical protein
MIAMELSLHILNNTGVNLLENFFKGGFAYVDRVDNSNIGGACYLLEKLCIIFREDGFFRFNPVYREDVEQFLFLRKVEG